MEFLKLCGITFILVMGLKIAMSEGMLLDKLGAYFENKVDEGKKVFNLFVCPWCMSTLGSIAAHVFAMALSVIPFGVNTHVLVRWPLVVMFSSLCCGLTWTIYETINRIREKNEEEANYFRRLFEAENEHPPN